MPRVLIERLAAPRHDPGRGLVGVRRPRVVSHFAGSGNQVKDPTLFAGPDIERAHRAFAAHSAEDQGILIDDSRRVQT